MIHLGLPMISSASATRKSFQQDVSMFIVCLPLIQVRTLLSHTSVYRYFALSSVIIFSFYKLLLKVDEDDFGGHTALLQEGLMASCGLFMVSSFHDCGLYSVNIFCSCLGVFVVPLLSALSRYRDCWLVKLSSTHSTAHKISDFLLCCAAGVDPESQHALGLWLAHHEELPRMHQSCCHWQMVS